jgi:aminoglycoside phosphotransferase (APT) family kinase protein
VDWECAGRGPVEWDVAAVAASWLLDSCDRAVGFLQGAEWPGAGGAAGAGSADVATVLSSIRDLLERYAEAGGQEMDAHFLGSCIATWIIGRSWVQASFHPAGLPPAMEFRLLLAEDVAANPDRLEGRA